MQNDGISRIVHRLRAVSGGGVPDVLPCGRLVFDLDEKKLAAYRVLVVKLLHRADHRQLVKLVDQLLFFAFPAACAHRDPRIRSGFGLTYRETFDVEAPAAEHAGNAVQHAELVMHQHCDRKSGHLIHLPLR